MPRKLAIKSKIERARRFAERLKDELGEQLNTVVLYDWVFGDEKEDFDIELVILTEQRDREVEDIVSKIAGEMEFESNYDTILTPTVRDKDEFKRRIKTGSPLEGELLAEGYVVYDDGFLSWLRRSELAAGQRNA